MKKNKTKITLTTVCISGIILGFSSTTSLANSWIANNPESILIDQGATSYTMKSGDTLWAIAVKTNVNVNTLASVNNINLTSGEQFVLQVGTVINFSESEIKATNSNGQAINDGVQTNDSNKIVADKPVGADVSAEVTHGNISTGDIIGKPDNTDKLPTPNNDDGSAYSETPSTPTNVNKYITINVDTNGNVLASTDGYTFVSKSTTSEKVVLENGDTVTTYTTTKVWSKAVAPSNEDKYVTINVDTNGNVLSSTSGYSYVSESTQSSVSTLPNGNTVTTYTTTVVWKKDAPEEVTPVTALGNSGILEKDLADAGKAAKTMHNDPNSQFYWGWFAVHEGSTDKVYAWKTIPVTMSNGETWYSVEFYVSYV